MSNVNQNQTQDQNRQKYRIQVIEPADFDAGIEESIKTTQRIALAVNQMFKPAFADYAGCAVACPNIDGRNMVMVIYPRFTIFPENAYDPNKHYAFNPNTLKTDNMLNKVATITSPIPNLKAMVKLTQDAKDAMEEFLFPMHKKNGKIKWEDQYVVARTNGQGANGQLIATFGNLDPMSIIRRLYGTCDEEGYQYEYKINVVSPINAGMGMQNQMQNYIIHMMRAKAGAAERAAADAGLMVSNQLPMYPAGMTMASWNGGNGFTPA